MKIEKTIEKIKELYALYEYDLTGIDARILEIEYELAEQINGLLKRESIRENRKELE